MGPLWWSRPPFPWAAALSSAEAIVILYLPSVLINLAMVTLPGAV